MSRSEFLHSICSLRFLYKNVPNEFQKRRVHNQEEIVKRKCVITSDHKRSDAIQRHVSLQVRNRRRDQSLISLKTKFKIYNLYNINLGPVFRIIILKFIIILILFLNIS